MPIALKQREAYDRGCRRIARRLLGECTTMLGPTFEQHAEDHTHAARTHLKRLRAMLRLLRPKLGEQIFCEDDRCYKRAGKKLAAARDATVMLETFDTTTNTMPATSAPNDAIKMLRSALVEAAASDAQLGEEVRAKLRDELRQARRRVADWPLTQPGFALVQPGLQATYRKCRRALRAAERKPTAESMHELRKHAKYLLYQLQFLRGKAGALNEQINQLSDLGHRLGDHHDLAVLHQFLDALPADDAAEAMRQPLQVQLAERMRELEAIVLPLARQCLTQRPAEFVRAVGSC